MLDGECNRDLVAVEAEEAEEEVDTSQKVKTFVIQFASIYGSREFEEQSSVWGIEGIGPNLVFFFFCSYNRVVVYLCFKF